jgi:bifunctional non-homologous end joining protein LigD
MVMYGTYDPFVLADIFLYAFDLLELDGRDLRREPLETRKATLASLLRFCGPGLRLNEHLAHDGESVFRHACKMAGHRLEAARLALSLRSVAGLAQVQEPRSASSETRGGGGLDTVIDDQ